MLDRILRRHLKIIVNIALVTLGVVCLARPAYAAAPHFYASFDYQYRYLSPFPSPEPEFLISISEQAHLTSVKTSTKLDYEYTFDYPESSVEYTYIVKDDIKSIPAEYQLEAFRNRRLVEITDRSSLDIRKRSLRQEQKKKAGGIFQITIPIRSRTFETIFGEGGAGLKVSGYRRITFSGRSSWTDKPQTAFQRQSKFPSLDMEQVYRFDITGTIGSKITVQVSQDSRNDLPLANRLILRYRGNEDDILQSVEAGNTTLDLPSTQFLRYSTRVQGLFGFKASAQLADVAVTAIASQEKGSTESVEISAGSATTSTDVINDIMYKKRTVYDLGRIVFQGGDSLYYPSRARTDTITEDGTYDFIFGQDSIVRAILYRDDATTDLEIRASRNPAICHVDPNNPSYDSIYTDIGNFEEIEPTSYYINPKEFFVLFLNSVIMTNDILAVYLEVQKTRNGNTFIDTIGNINRTDDTLILKLIKPKEHTRINHHIWEYEWKNVYYLGGTQLELTDIEVQIYKGSLTNTRQVNPEDPFEQDGIGYLQIMGLDQYNESDQFIPDGKIDKTVGLIDPALGLLYFQDRHPFDSRIAYAFNDGDEPIYLKDSVPELYLSPNATVVSQSSRYYLAITSKRRGSSEIQLNAYNIIEGSEVLTYDNRRLTSGVDYRINYDLGTIILLKDEYTNPGSNLSIMFEKAPFFSLSKKTLLGTRLEYKPSREFRLGTTIIYKSDKSTNRKPKIGEETSRITVWDIDFDYRFESPLITKMVNALPMVSAKSASNVRLAGELAQSFPNPNVDGNVYIDDFEGSKDSYSLGIMRTLWRKSSSPEQKIGIETERARIGWYNPIDAYSTEDVWNRDEGGANIANVMVLYFEPVDFQRINDTDNEIIDSTSVSIEPENSWNGIMRNIPDGVVSQLENAQLLEIRMRGDVGVMHVDLGVISEDIDGDGNLDNEDKDGFHILDDDEDVGLDGLPDALEFGYDPAQGVTDPAGDNYNPDDIWHMNGTEGNAEDGEGGYRPDTEDPSPYNGLNRFNDYFSYKVNLADSQFEVARNDSNWKTVRIPLRDPEALDTIIGTAYWSEIRYVRIWFDSLGQEYLNMGNPLPNMKLEIAGIELISTTWADSLFVADSLRSGPVSYDVAVINTEVDNDRYVPPPGVEGYYDPTRDIVEKEQSLLLTFSNLNSQILINSPDSGLVLAADTGLAVRRFSGVASNYMGYGRLEAFVNSTVAKEDSVMFFLRLGPDKRSYYEFRTMLDSGLWNPSNYVNINFDSITRLKGALLELRDQGLDSSLVIQDGNYLVKISTNERDPTLTRIQYLAMGVVNLSKSKNATGEIWIDELRLTNVRNDVGRAARVAVNGNLSDLMTYNFGYSYQDAFYRSPSVSTTGGAANNLGSGQTRESYSFSGTVNLEKLFPRSFDMDIPVSVNWSQNVREPLLQAGSDISVPDELKRREATVDISKSFRVSESFNKKTKNPLFTFLLNRLKTSFSYNTATGHAPTRPYYFTEGYNAVANYAYSMGTTPSIKPLAWMSLFRVPFGLPGTTLYLMPYQVSMNGTLRGSYSRSYNEDGPNPPSSSRTFSGSMNIGFKVFNTLGGGYGFSTTRDLKDPNLINITINPKKFKLGIEKSYNQNFNLNYNPQIFSFLTHKFDYSARYSDQYNFTRDSIFYHNASVNTSMSLSGSLKHRSIFGSNKSRGPRDAREKKGGSFFLLSLYKTTLTGIRYITDALKPVSVKLNRTRSISYPSLESKATMLCRLGFTEDPGVNSLNTSTTVARGQKWISESITANSGVTLFKGISTDLTYTRKIRETFDVANPTTSVNTVWPTMRFNIKRISGLWLLGDLINFLSPSTGYTRSVDTKKNTNAAYLADKKIRYAHSPLLAFNLPFSRTLRLGGRFERGRSVAESYNDSNGDVRNKTRSTSSGFSFNSSYSFSSPTGIKIPLFGRIKFQSAMSISADVSYKKDRSETANAASGDEYKVTSENTSLAIRPSASYSFSANVKGGISARWQDNHNLSSKTKTHTRELSIWVEMRF